MSKTLALVSGKGGSGKTTLALSIASMLSNCYIKTLLVDCDLSTNGATYFYENKLDTKSEKIGSFYSIFISRENSIEDVIQINEHMDFIPSITKITETNTETYYYNRQDLNVTTDIYRRLNQKYDVIIYDCQAGYTDILKLLLPYVDINLVVMEADAISSAAIRSLYLKIGSLLNERKIYQIFNKVSNEEYQIYSKISGGTVFTNIATIMFDWKIRKAFAVAQIPDMENTGAFYGEQIYNVCKILFNDDYILEKLNRYGTKIKIRKKEEDEHILEEKILQLTVDHKKNRAQIIKMVYTLLVPISLSTILAFFAKMVDENRFSSGISSFNIFIIMMITSIVTILFSVVLLNNFSKEKKNETKELDANNKKLDEILAEKSILKKQLEKIETENNKQK